MTRFLSSEAYERELELLDRAKSLVQEIQGVVTELDRVIKEPTDDDDVR